MVSDTLYGLVLTGGKSTRMGIDKGMIPYHGLPQREYLYRLMEPLCHATFMSIREEQACEFNGDYNLIIDQNKYQGPYNGILSAHQFDPRASWLVLACDLPLIDQKALEFLIGERNPNKMATTYATRHSGLPEPLCAIWEPEGLQRSLAYLGSGSGTSPRKFLINGNIKLLYPYNDEVLLNANYKKDYKKVLLKI
jgi:molybdopterin-guanine dinucleotide biosynthesis protein A